MSIYPLLANAVLVTHFAFVAFVVLMLPCIFFGAWRNWQWVRRRWLRVLHVAAIGIVVLQSWVGRVCPLTDLEMWLRAHGDEGIYTGSFIEYWLHRLLYWDLPTWVFSVAYSLFGLLVIVAWYFVPPVRVRQQ